MIANIEVINKWKDRNVYKLSYESEWKQKEEISPFLEYLINIVKDKVETIVIKL